MKKLYFAVLLCFFAKTISAQQYIPILDSVNIWTYTGNYIGVRLANPDSNPATYSPCNYPSSSYGWGEYQQTGNDTVINLTTYRILLDEFYHCLFGYVREDTAAKKVYFLDIAGNPEVLLYDFSMQVGDSIPVNFPYSSQNYFHNGNFRLDSIGQIHINAGWRRIFYLNNHVNGGFTLTWVESVGNQAAFVYPYWENQYANILFSSCYGFPHDAGQLLTCFDHDYKVYYDSCALYLAMHNGPCIGYQDSCDYGNVCGGINESESLTSIAVYPNPSNGKINLSLNVAEKDYFEIVIWDNTGKELVRNISIGNLSPGKSEVQMNLDEIPAGFYLMELRGEKGSVYRKLLIER